MPHLVDAEFSRRLELRLGDQASGDVEQVGCANPAGDDPLLNLRGGDDQNFPANVLCDEAREGSPLTIPAPAKPVPNAPEHSPRLFRRTTPFTCRGRW